MSDTTVSTIDDYLAQLAATLEGEDPALIQDALQDAEEHLRGEIAEQPDKSEAEILRKIASSYGNPEEVAEEYRKTEETVSAALAFQPRSREKSASTGFFGVLKDSTAYSALFYMLLSLMTGVVYFTITVTGFSLSLGLAVLIVGILVLLLFLSIERALSFAEGRIVESLLGVRMPRRIQYEKPNQPFFERLKYMVTDSQTWSTMLYMILMLPLGILYFVIAVTGMTTSIAFLLTPVFALLVVTGATGLPEGEVVGLWATPLIFLAGVFLLPSLLHVAKFVARFHGSLAKSLLVPRIVPAR